jgi:hypothetical protein
VLRADWIEEIPVPNAEARHAIIADALAELAKRWPRVAEL